MAGVMSHFKKNKGPNVVGQRSNEELWTRTGTFINKPTRGWLHVEEELKDHGGVCYGVRYVGCVEVKQSMRTLPFEMRGQVTKEAIFRVCDAAGFKYNRKKKASKTICKIIGENPNILFGGANVNLTISTASINIRIKETGKPIANHQMQGISFASGGDAETQNYVAYVAKDPVNGRACHVLECLAGLAQDVITTIGQAFEIRFKDYLRNPPQVFSTPDRMEEPLFQEEESAWGEDPDYYNDISKLSVNHPAGDRGVPPPPSGQYMPTSPTRQQPYQALLSQQLSNSSSSSPVGPPPGYTANPPPYYDNNNCPSPVGQQPHDAGVQGSPQQPTTGRLIDIDNEPPVYGATAATPMQTRNNAPTALDNPLHRSFGGMMYDDQRPLSANYDNPQSPKFTDRKMMEGTYNASLPNHSLHMDVGQQRATNNGDQHSVDPFDMEPFNPEAARQPSNPSQIGGGVGGDGSASAPPANANPLYNEEWFHGPMNRKEGEALLSNDGDFLVRESTTAKDQYVLSGMQNNAPKHLLLVDPQGKVRTKDKEFDSVSHLINYHRNNRLPIISAGSAVHLKNPVIRKFNT